MSNNQKIDSAVKKNIKKAVDQIPKLVLEEKNSINQFNLKKQWMLWVGVIIITLIIFIMWFINTRSTFYNINKETENSQTSKIFNTGTENLREIVEEVTEVKEKAKAQIVDAKKNSLFAIASSNIDDLVKVISNITSSTTSTPN